MPTLALLDQSWLDPFVKDREARQIAITREHCSVQKRSDQWN